MFIGGVLGFAALAVPNPLLPIGGGIGLYEHFVGMSSLEPSQRRALLVHWQVPTSSLPEVAEIGTLIVEADIDHAITSAYGQDRRLPIEVNMNFSGDGNGTGRFVAPPGAAHPGKVYGHFVTSGDLATAELAAQLAYRHGAASVAFNFTPNDLEADIDDPFDTSPFWANVRTAALFGGGLAIDAPPSYFFSRGSAYVLFIAQMIRWANQSGLRSSLIVAPFSTTGSRGPAGFDSQLEVNTGKMADYLASVRALPTQWIVENYGIADAMGPAAENTATSPTNDLVSVALRLAKPGTTSPPGSRPAELSGVSERAILSRQHS